MRSKTSRRSSSTHKSSTKSSSVSTPPTGEPAASTGVSPSLSADEYGIVSLGGMRVGLVEASRIKQRRDNPRAMKPKELEALRKSVERFGFKSFVVVEELAPGEYGIVDGHHRVK